MWMCIAPYRGHTSKALTHSQGISQFYLHTPPTFATGMNHTCLCLPSWSWYSFADPRGMEGWVGLGWLVTYRNKCPAPGIEPDMVAHLSTNWAQRRLTLLIEANALTTTPDHQHRMSHSDSFVEHSKRISLVTDSCSAEWQCFCALCTNWLTYLFIQLDSSSGLSF